MDLANAYARRAQIASKRSMNSNSHIIIRTEPKSGATFMIGRSPAVNVTDLNKKDFSGKQISFDGTKIVCRRAI